MVGLLPYMQSRLTVPRIVGLAALLAVALTAFAGASLVVAQRGEPGEPPAIESFQGCVNNYTGVLRIIDEGQQCAAHETPIQLDSGAGNDDLLARIEALEQQTADQQTEIDALTQANSDQQTAISNLTTENQTQQATINNLMSENQTQQATISNLTTENGTQQDEIDALELRVDALENNPVTLPACLTTEAVEGQTKDDIVFNGCNVHVRDGSGDTGGEVNGLGNLIVGYNETPGDDTRTGSHNLVVGPNHSYTSSGGFVTGFDNEISGPFSSVTGGNENTASGSSSSVSGGYRNRANGNNSSITGGQSNIASGYLSSISGGYQNQANGNTSSISGGNSNTTGADTYYASVSGGFTNHANGNSSSVSGGTRNIASGNFSSVSGGFTNTAEGLYSTIAGDDYFTEG